MGRFVLVVIFASGCSRSEEVDETQRCEQVRDRIVDLRLANATNVDIKAHRVAMRDALGTDFVTSCKSGMTPSQQQCVLEARDLVTATACSSQQ